MRNIERKPRDMLAVETKYLHTHYNKADAKSGVVRRNDCVKITMKFVNRDIEEIYKASIVFENNVIPKRLHKGFIHINPKELENRYALAKSEICREIMKEYEDKKRELDAKIISLRQYCNVSIGVIPQEFTGENINVIDAREIPKKHSYDM